MREPWQDLFGLPEVVEIEPTETCNLRCKMCHVSYMSSESRPALSAEAVDNLSCLKGKHVIVGSGFEPTMNRQFAKIVQSLNKTGAQIELITNGTLLKGEVKDALLDSDLYLVTFSFDGIRKETYEKIRRRAHFEDVLENITNFRSEFSQRETYFSVNSTMMKSNMAEATEALQFWDRHNFDTIGFITMVVRDLNEDLIKECLYPVRDEYRQHINAAAEDVILNRRRISMSSPVVPTLPVTAKYPGATLHTSIRSDRPDVRRFRNIRIERQLGEFPGMPVTCKSPFTFARVDSAANVQLCYQFTIGNLNTASFEDIWFGENATAVRRNLLSDSKYCERCDYYRFCLNAHALDFDRIEDHFSHNFAPYLDKVDFDYGVCTAEIEQSEPRYIKSVGEFNIVHFKSHYYVIPQAMGPFDLRHVELAAMPQIRAMKTLRDAEELVPLLSRPLANVIATETLLKIGASH